jgi:hypothetical protein
MKRPKKRPEGLKPVSFGSDDNGSKASSKSNSSGGKGGGKSVNPSTSKGQKAITASRTKKSGFGYYDDAGKYVPAYIDAFDGGGMNQQGTYFAGGPLSNILNVMKVAPKGSGDVPRERIGYRDLTDMFDEGGPQASGGGFRGAGGFSGLGNIANMLAGNESERVGYYDEGGRFYEPPAAPAPSGVLGSVQNNNAVFPSYANMPMGEAGRGEVPMQAGRPNPQMGIPMPKAPLPAAPSYLMPSSMQMPMQQESSGSPAEQPTGQMRQAATGLTYAPPTSSAEVDFMKSELFKEGYIVDGYGDSDIKELYKLFVQ